MRVAVLIGTVLMFVACGGQVAHLGGSPGERWSEDGGGAGGGPEDGASRDAPASADVVLPPLDAALASLDAAPPGLAGFALIVNDVVQHPMSCPGSDWEFPPYPFTSHMTCGFDSCPGVASAELVNNGALPMAYVLGFVWNSGGGYVPGVVPNVEIAASGGKYLVGVLAPGAVLNITSAFAERLVGLVGSAEPFSSPGGGYINDETTIPWPAGVAGSGGSSMMYVAELEVWSTCQLPLKLW